MRININQKVKLKISARGVKVFDEHHKKLGLDPTPYREMATRGQEPGIYGLQLWEAFHIFGSVCFMGSEPPFGPTIEIEE